MTEFISDKATTIKEVFDELKNIGEIDRGAQDAMQEAFERVKAILSVPPYEDSGYMSSISETIQGNITRKEEWQRIQGLIG